MNKNVHIIAGPNGSGKTTFSKEFLPDHAKCPNFINADYIAQGLSPFSPVQAALIAKAKNGGITVNDEILFERIITQAGVTL